MRTKNQILESGERTDLKILEVLLDIRDMVHKATKVKRKPRKPKGG